MWFYISLHLSWAHHCLVLIQRIPSCILNLKEPNDAQMGWTRTWPRRYWELSPWWLDGRMSGMSTPTSGKTGLPSKQPRFLWVSLETIKTTKTQRHPGCSQGKVTWELIFERHPKTPQSHLKATSKTLKATSKPPQRHSKTPQSQFKDTSKTPQRYSKTLKDSQRYPRMTQTSKNPWSFSVSKITNE